MERYVSVALFAPRKAEALGLASNTDGIPNPRYRLLPVAVSNSP